MDYVDLEDGGDNNAIEKSNVYTVPVQDTVQESEPTVDSVTEITGPTSSKKNSRKLTKKQSSLIKGSWTGDSDDEDDDDPDEVTGGDNTVNAQHD